MFELDADKPCEAVLGCTRRTGGAGALTVQFVGKSCSLKAIFVDAIIGSWARSLGLCRISTPNKQKIERITGKVHSVTGSSSLFIPYIF